MASRRNRSGRASGRKPLQRHPALTWTVELNKHHLLVLTQLHLPVADIHGDLITKHQSLQMSMGIARLIIRNATAQFQVVMLPASAWGCLQAQPPLQIHEQSFLHFIDDHSSGGHVLDVKADALEVELDFQSNLRLALPETKQFLEADLSRDISEDLHQAEGVSR